ncbi:Predicted endonuclease distantly related to archaeal Holliday junction resolvase [hydrothermal vent metagenome]|uniref:Predicted endonuclease distantly related to archaeal Holliday junction resolvase n=1 Tax=hydrothermal vent metagenome TaxID=652676 RepID=A0A1W1D2F1_9ZZZZ
MSRAKGNKAEERACAFLEENGFFIIKRNFYSRFGEIDIIAKKSNLLYFIEVKSGEDYESAIYNITPSKLRKILKTGDVYLKKHHYQGDYQYDAIIVTPENIWHIENITL